MLSEVCDFAIIKRYSETIMYLKRSCKLRLAKGQGGKIEKKKLNHRV